MKCLLTNALWGLLLCSSPLLAGTAESDQDWARRVAPCTQCHGDQGRATRDGYFPRIAGKPALYLYNQLLNFQQGARRHALMSHMVDRLSDDYLWAISQHFARQHPPYPPPQPAELPASVLKLGEQLALRGAPERGIPACVDCHGTRLTGVLPAVPGLAGLPSDYISAQIGAWQIGIRRAAAPDCMGQIALQMQPKDVQAVSAWLASRPLPTSSRPEPAAPARFPLGCGAHQYGARP